VVGLEYDWQRAQEARLVSEQILCAAGENLPFLGGNFDLILSHEVLEHVLDDRMAVQEMVRALRVGGRIVIFAPNRGYPFETHGVFIGEDYIFGNIPWSITCPGACEIARATRSGYSYRDLSSCLPVFRSLHPANRTVWMYDNITGAALTGRGLRLCFRGLKTPLRFLGLSHVDRREI
jgi:SAM-dependent methyltransferase